MKKLILFLFLLPFLVDAQVQMSQVNGLISKLNLKQDTLHGVGFVKISGKTISYDNSNYLTSETDPIFNTSVAKKINAIDTVKWNAKQDTLPFPSTRTGDTFLNDLGTFSAPPSSGGGSASGTPVYFWPTNSPTSGYLELDYTPYSSVVENTYSIPVGTTLLSSHLTDLQIATTTIDAGNWYISSRSKVNNLSGSTKLHVDFFLYHLDGTTTVLFGGDSETFSTTDYKVYQGQLPEASFQCVTTDRLGVSIYAINTGGATKTLTISLGQGIATFFSAPLRIRHSNLRDKNGEAAFQHLTSEQVSIVNATSGTNTGDETKTTIQNKLGAASYTNSGYLTSTEWGEFKGKVTFPGFGTSHTTAAYGDHLHTGTYEVPLTFSTGLTRTGNTITNNITQYTDAMARSAQLTANSTTTGLLTSSDWNTFNNKQPSGSYAPASGSINYIQNQNNSAQSANMWINGKIRNSITNNASFISNWTGSNWFGIGSTTANHLIRLGMTDGEGAFQNAPGDILFQVDGSATFASTVNSTGFLLNGNNLTSSLSTNYLPKWNGSSFVNSLISDNGTYVNLNSTTQSTSPTTGALVTPGGIGVGGGIYSSGNIITNADVNGDVANFNAFVKSGGTSSQFLKANGSVDATNYQPAITLTTNGTSGAATFNGVTLNIPNYSTLNGNFISATVNKTSTRTLTNNDCWVSCENTTTITLPTTASIGKVFYIKGNPYGVGSDVTIECNENFDLIQNLSNYITSYTISSGTAKTIMLVWDGYHWQLTTLN